MPRGTPTTELVTVLFTDIVASTDIARELGDRGWRDLVAAHHSLVRDRLKRHHGREQDTAGDGFFATFSRPAEAIRCAFEVSQDVRELGLEIRAGLHLGEAEVMGPKVGGVAVNTAARIMGLGKAGEVLVSATVRDAVAGKGIEFADHGVHQLKGLDGEYRVFDAISIDGEARGLPLEPEEAKRRREAGPSDHQTRRRPWWLVAAGVGVLAAAGIGIATTLRASEDAETAPTASTGAVEGRALTEADSHLIERVPPAFAASCVATDPLPRGAVGSVTCADGDYEARFDTYADAGALEAAFATNIAGLELAGPSCRDERAATGSYTVDGISRGRVACFVEAVTSLAWGSAIVWTDDQLLILGRAAHQDVTSFEGNVPDLSLYEWWRVAAGPSSGGSFRPKDEPADVPSGTFRSVITAEQVGPTNEGGADSRWVGTWTITLDGEVFVEELEGEYRVESELLWGKGDRMVLRRDYQFPPLGGVTEPCQRYESLHWELTGDTLVFSEPSPETACQAFRRLAVYQPWERVG